MKNIQTTWGSKNAEDLFSIATRIAGFEAIALMKEISKLSKISAKVKESTVSQAMANYNIVNNNFIIQQKHIDYLNQLRESGLGTRYGAWLCLQKTFPVPQDHAAIILEYWMDNFDEKGTY